MKSRLPVVLSLVFASLLAACGGGAPLTSAPPAGEGAEAAPTFAPSQPTVAPAQPGNPSPSAGMDVSTIHLCQLLPRAELAGLAGGTPYEGADSGGPVCIYTIDPGDGTAELYSFSVSSPDLVAPLIDYVRGNEDAEWFTDLGNVAYLQASDLGEGYDLVILVEGEYGVSLGGPHPEVLEAAGRLIVERLGR